MNDYQKEQYETLSLVRDYIGALSPEDKVRLKELISEYLDFRQCIDAFQEAHFSNICTRTCYQNRLSACCSKDGIITFFADVVINALGSKDKELASLEQILQQSNPGFKCIYLNPDGCRWRIKPIVCEMFLCDRAKTEIFAHDVEAEYEWKQLEKLKKKFTWPDQPVLFDQLETIFLDAGYTAATMYLHNGPGLLLVKQKAGPLICCLKNRNSDKALCYPAE